MTDIPGAKQLWLRKKGNKATNANTPACLECLERGQRSRGVGSGRDGREEEEREREHREGETEMGSSGHWRAAQTPPGFSSYSPLCPDRALKQDQYPRDEPTLLTPKGASMA